MWERANVPASVIKVMIDPAPVTATVGAGTSPILIDPNLPPPEVWSNSDRPVQGL